MPLIFKVCSRLKTLCSLVIFYEFCYLINYPWVSLVHQLLVTLLYCQVKTSWFTLKVGTHLYLAFSRIGTSIETPSHYAGIPFHHTCIFYNS